MQAVVQYEYCLHLTVVHDAVLCSQSFGGTTRVFNCLQQFTQNTLAVGVGLTKNEVSDLASDGGSNSTATINQKHKIAFHQRDTGGQRRNRCTEYLRTTAAKENVPLKHVLQC